MYYNYSCNAFCLEKKKEKKKRRFYKIRVCDNSYLSVVCERVTVAYSHQFSISNIKNMCYVTVTFIFIIIVTTEIKLLTRSCYFNLIQ